MLSKLVRNDNCRSHSLAGNVKIDVPPMIKKKINT